MRRGLPRLLELLFSHRRATMIGLFAVVVSDCAQLALPWVTKWIVDRLEDQSMTHNQLWLAGGVILALAALSFVAKQVWRHLILGSSRKVEAELRRQLLDKTLGLSMARAKSTDTGKFMALASSDIPAVGQALAFGVVACFDTFFMSAVAFALMIKISPLLTAWSLLPFLILAGFMLVTLRLVYKRWESVQEATEVLTEKTRESLSGIRTLRAYVQARGDQESFRKGNEEFLEKVMAYVRIDASFAPIILLLAGSSSALLLIVGGQLVLKGTIGIGSLAAFIGYLGLLTWPMIAAGWMLVLIQRGSASISRLDEILQAENEAESKPELPAQGTSALQIKNLTFGYTEGEAVLQDWSLEARPGAVLGLVGPVGGGKSTLFRLLLQLEKAPAGTLLWGEHDLTRYEPGSVRALFSVVSQEPFLFSDTIANNLRLAAPQATDEQLRAAVELADLSSDLEQFPQGLETLLGEKGVSLSGGQRQRAALARAWLKDTPFLLLDDTLSAVDTLTEKRILKALSQPGRERDRTTIIISHRLSAVRGADEILVCDAGRIVDRGTHEELAARPGLYQQMLSLQEAEEEVARD